MLISRTNRRISSGTIGLPPRHLDFRRQYNLKPARCQRTMVSGLTIAKASQTLGNNRQAWKQAKNEDIAASIVGFIRQAALGDPLVPWADRVKAAMDGPLVARAYA